MNHQEPDAEVPAAALVWFLLKLAGFATAKQGSITDFFNNCGKREHDRI